MSRHALNFAIAWLILGMSGLLQAAPRVVSVGGDVSEIVVALGQQASLVGVDTTSTWPEALTELPQVGYQRTLSAEGILSLRPDVLLLSSEAGPPTVLQQIEQAGVMLYRMPDTPSFAGLQAKIRVVGEALLQAERAAELNQQLLQVWQALPMPESRVRAGFAFLHGQGVPIWAGQGTRAHALLELVGADNAFADWRGYRQVNPETLLAAAPDWIITTTESLESAGGEVGFWQLAGLSSLPASERPKLWAAGGLYLLGFGPRLHQVVAELRQALHSSVTLAP